MANWKKWFILYADQHELFEELSDEQAGKLIKHILLYVNDKNPDPPNEAIVKMAFIPIKQTLKRDLKKREEERRKRSDAGKKWMASRWWNDDNNDKSVKNDITKNKSVKNDITKITDSVSVSDSVSVNDTKEKYWKYVTLKKVEYEKLIELYWKSVVDDKIDDVNIYCWSHWKKYKDYYLTILWWIKRDNKNSAPTTPKKSNDEILQEFLAEQT